MRADGITPAEFERARHQLRARLVFESDSVTNIAHQIGYFHTLRDVGPLSRPGGGGWQRVTLEDVARVARDVSGAGDDARSGGFSLSDACRWRPLMATAVHRGLAPLDEASGQRRRRDRAADRHAPRRDDSCQRRRRSPGTTPIGAGHARTSWPRSSIAAPSRTRLKRWPRRSTAAASSLSVSVSRHLMTFTCTCLAEDVEEILGLVAGVVRHPTFPPDQVELRRVVDHHVHPAGRGQPRRGRHRSVDGRAVPGRPSVRPAAPRARSASIQAIARDDLVEFHRAHVGARTLRVVIVGDVEAATGGAAGRRRVWRLDSRRWAAAGAAAGATPRGARTSQTIAMPGKAQSDIAYGFTSVARPIRGTTRSR